MTNSSVAMIHVAGLLLRWGGGIAVPGAEHLSLRAWAALMLMLWAALTIQVKEEILILVKVKKEMKRGIWKSHSVMPNWRFPIWLLCELLLLQQQKQINTSTMPKMESKNLASKQFSLAKLKAVANVTRSALYDDYMEHSFKFLWFFKEQIHGL